MSEQEFFKPEMIWENKSGWLPPQSLIESLQQKARSLGLRWQWVLVAALENGDLMLEYDFTTDDGIIAKRRGEDWVFCLDSGEPIFAADRRATKGRV